MMTYQNPIIPGFHPDPSICRVGEDYYLVTSTFEYFPGVPIFHSRDLVHWRKIGHCLTRESQLSLADLPCSAGIYAATIRHHKGMFYMVTTAIGQGGHFFITATDPAGEWSDPVWVDQPEIDPSLLFDGDRVYFIASPAWQAEIDIATGKLLTEKKLIWPGSGGGHVEAPHLYKIDDWYYLLVAEGGTHHAHMVNIARSRSPWGPFDACPHNPILSHRSYPQFPIQAVGHADLLEDHKGNWWVVCLGVRRDNISFPSIHLLGRETFLAPVTWTEEGWPIVNGTGTLALEMEALLPAWAPLPAASTRDDFDQPALDLEWVHLRQLPRYSLTERAGWLRLWGNPSTLSENAAPACVLRRQTAFDFTTETLLDFEPKTDGEEAGLTVLMNTTHHYDLRVVRVAGQRRIELRLQVGDMTVVRFSAALSAGLIHLRVEGSVREYRFSFAVGDAAWNEAGHGLARYLSSEVAGGFTGVMVGAYATGNGRSNAASADFDWFDYDIKAL